MKKITLLFLSLLFSASLFAQKMPEKKFQTQQSFDNIHLTFKEDSFYYRHSSCYISDVGKGVYKIINDSLFLHFINEGPMEISYTESNISCYTEDSVALHLYFKDKRLNIGIPYVEIETENSSKLRLDPNGNAILKVKKQDSLTIRFILFGSHNYSLTIKADTCKKIDVGIGGDHFAHVIPNGSVFSYKILQAKEDQLVLVSKGKMYILGIGDGYNPENTNRKRRIRWRK